MKIVEKYYSVRELAWLIGFGETYIRARIKEGAFSPGGDPGTNIVAIGADIRVPASGVLHWLASHPLRPIGVGARTPGELRRKVMEVDNE